MRKKLAVLLLLLNTSHVYAGFWGFTMHSRANCIGFNESISWEAGHSYNLMTYAYHVSTKPDKWWTCHFNTPMQKTWRSAAYHYAEGWEGDEWTVTGYHYAKNEQGDVILLKITEGIDCSGYNGWWDV